MGHSEKFDLFLSAVSSSGIVDGQHRRTQAALEILRLEDIKAAMIRSSLLHEATSDHRYVEFQRGS